MNNGLSATVKAMAEARRDLRRFEIPQDLDGVSPETAYAVQNGYVAAVGMPVGGYKLAVNGAPQMAHFGVSEPVSARIFTAEMYDSGAVLSISGFEAVSIEPEIAAVMGPGVETLSGPVDRAGAMAAIACFRPAIELIDQRGIPMPEVSLAQAIALNVFNAGIVLGAGRVAPDALDLDGLEVALDLDGERAAQATGAAPQHPGDAVAWLIGHLAARGLTLTPGMVVMCGTHLPLRVLDPGVRQVDVTMGALGAVGFSLAG
ncbi:MAG: fumarylacetoacetate hydrolase family protein [Antarcticimicrobium sp.]|nr:fumarylacetoacetate hydrolase family protein [Antarcticimicrobium sp.]